MVDDGGARWVSPNAVQLTEHTPDLIADQPTITDSECEINAGAYAGIRRGAAEGLSARHVEAVRNKVAVWPEIYDHKAPLPGHCRVSDCGNTPGIRLMSRQELQKLSSLQVAFIGLEAQSSNYSLRKSKMRAMRDDYVLQHYGDDEAEPESEVAVGYHELDASELEA